MTNYLEDIAKNLAQAITYDSSQAEAKPGMPFGEGAAKCLDFYLSLAEFMGFETKNYDNYIGEAVWGTGKDFAVAEAFCYLCAVFFKIRDDGR